MNIKNIVKIKGFKYIVATVLFVVIIVFVDQNNLIVTWRLQRQVNRLHAEERDLREALVQDSTNNAQIKNNPDAKEHYGRENYYMKRPDEDIFVIK